MIVTMLKISYSNAYKLCLRIIISLTLVDKIRKPVYIYLKKSDTRIVYSWIKRKYVVFILKWINAHS